MFPYQIAKNLITMRTTLDEILLYFSAPLLSLQKFHVIIFSFMLLCSVSECPTQLSCAFEIMVIILQTWMSAWQELDTPCCRLVEWREHADPGYNANLRGLTANERGSQPEALLCMAAAFLGTVSQWTWRCIYICTWFFSFATQWATSKWYTLSHLCLSHIKYM